MRSKSIEGKLVVVHKESIGARQPHKLSEDERRARRVRNCLKARKAAERFSARQKATSAWRARAKEIRAIKRQGFQGLIDAQERSFAQVRTVEVDK